MLCSQLSVLSAQLFVLLAAMYSAVAIPADSAVQPVRSDSDNAAQPGKVPIIEVAFKNDMWWSIPMDMSRLIYQEYEQDKDACYTWDWGNARTGSWVHEDEETSINRYVIDFRAMQQKNIDNGRLRTIRIVWVRLADIEPRWTGEIPT